MFQGHPILADIRKGFKLRPTNTVDKSKPIIVAEDEETPSIKYVKPDKPADLSYLYIKKPDPDDIVVWRPRSIVPPPIIHKGKAVDGPIVHSRPTTPNPPSDAALKNPTLLKLGGSNQQVDRQALLKSIQGGIKLRKTVTSDRSGLILDDEYLDEIKNRPTTPTPMSTQDETAENGSQSTNRRVSTDSVKSDTEPPKPVKARRKSSTTKKPSTPTTPKSPVKKVEVAKVSSNAPPPPPPMAMSFATPIANAPPPPPPMAMSFAKPVANAPPPPPMPTFNRTNNTASPAPPAMPPPPPPLMPSSYQQAPKAPPVQKYEPPKRNEPKPEPKVEAKKCDVAFEEKNLYVTKENLESEIKKGSASNRIALFKQFEQKDSYIPMPKSAAPPTGKLKIIENTPKDEPITNGRLKIHEGPTTTLTIKKPEPEKPSKFDSSKTSKFEPEKPSKFDSLKTSKFEPVKTSKFDSSKTSKFEPEKTNKIEPMKKTKAPETPPDVTATFTLPTAKYTVPITVKTDDPTPTKTAPKKKVKKLSNGTVKKTPTKVKAENTLSPTSRCDSLSPNSATSSAYQSGISSPNSVSSISPKSKSSGVSSTTSSVSPPIRTTSINGAAKDDPFSSYNPKTRSITSERFSKLRQSFSDKPENGTTLLGTSRPTTDKLKESGEEFWKNAVAKTNGTSPSTTSKTAHPVEIKTPWKASSSISSSSTTSSTTSPLSRTTLTTKKPPAVPPKRTPISIKLSNSYSQNNNSYFDSSSTTNDNDPLALRQRYKFNIDFGRNECPVEIVQL